MRILVSNDDGVDAPGIHALAQALASLGEVITVAPATEQSAQSHAISLHAPLRVEQRGPGRFAVSGTPADAVYLGVHHVCEERPGLVVSGINRGPNISDDVWYSGTVAAAREGAMCGVPALAVSLEKRPVGDAERHWQTAAELATQVARRMLDAVAREPRLATGEERLLINLNVPDRPLDALGDWKVCPLADRHYVPQVHVNEDPRGRRYFWIGGVSKGFADQPGTDGWWFHRGHPTLTALRMQITEPRREAWLEGLLDGADPTALD